MSDEELKEKLIEARKVHPQEKGCKNSEYIKLLEEIVRLRWEIKCMRKGKT